jgi:ATP-dependent Clp protease protease subunit
MNRKVIRFMAEINHQSVTALMNTVGQLKNQGCKSILLLISSPGGSVVHGISAYNFLKETGLDIATCNYGSVDSIATVIYCAGTKRYSVPNARFVVHGITFGVQGGASFEEKKLKEILDGLRADRENIAKIIADNCKKSQEEIEKIMFEGTTFSPEQAKDLGLVTENITTGIIADGEEIIGIG